MTTQVELESRLCPNCGRNFRVMTKSPTQHCSAQCKEFGIVGRGAVQKELKRKENHRTVVSVNTTQDTRKKSTLLEGPIVPWGFWPKKKEKYQDETTSKTRREEMPNVQNGVAETKRDNLSFKEKTTTQGEQKTLQKSTKVVTGETLPVSSDEPLSIIEVESSAMLNLSKRSANRLLAMMESAVSDDDLDRSKDGSQRLELHRIETAIRCANSITSIVQANVNLLKAMRK